MTSTSPDTSELHIRPYLRRDLEQIEQLLLQAARAEESDGQAHPLRHVRRWYGLVKGLSWFPNPLQHMFCTYVAEKGDRIRGAIQVSPFNRTGSTWRIDRIVLGSPESAANGQALPVDLGSHLIRYCLQHVLEARTWLIELNVNDSKLISLSRQNGFQPLAQMTYWSISAEALKHLASDEPDLPNLLPVRNSDAVLLHQLDTFSMPPTVRQVFDRSVPDFRVGMTTSFAKGVKHWFERTEVVRGYIFEPQRKAAIGHFHLQLCRNGSEPHTADLTVHPEYTWLYPELVCQMARAAQAYPDQALHVTSTDYQPEREEYLNSMGAEPIEHSLLLSRSVWHKVRETRPLEGLQLTEMLQGLQTNRKPVPSRFSMIDPLRMSPFQSKTDAQPGEGSSGSRPGPRLNADEARQKPAGSPPDAEPTV
ncbi:GNAT family N-acetyltransferase [Leptolyngbya sp. AN02str]|uniref:GNAT family N-acetyltransferase n=1 Tax=Leptolyngbya sp. AN02str TaxID=3423363 RepID=UPI003D3208FD